MKPSAHNGSKNRGGTSGYTLIEIVLALAVLSIITGVMVNSFIEVMRARQRVSAEHECRLLESRIAGRIWLGESALEAGENERDGWTVTYKPAEVASGATNIVWHTWTVSPSNMPAYERTIYLRAGGQRE